MTADDAPDQADADQTDADQADATPPDAAPGADAGAAPGAAPDADAGAGPPGLPAGAGAPRSPFAPVAPERISAAVIRQVEELILQGVLRPGERLPPERELAAALDVSRPTLREALAELERRGLVRTRRGAGVYVAEVLGSAFAPPLIELFATHDLALYDYLAFRRDLEGMAAERAAVQATPSDRAAIAAAFARMEAAHAARAHDEEARRDADFHMAVVEAAHNVVMLHMMRSMFELLRRGVFYNRDKLFSLAATREALLAQHRAIRDAVVEGRPEAAKAAVEAHLDYVAAQMREVGRRDRLEAVAALRLAAAERGRG
ncbi:FCD domain-containing protein [Rhodovulum sp. DZ06]|uniref:FCD domain-containing protein n=1 Tax=Rhodovulum sp. DZ06 TaxID=3425126 RepID=UPI003D35724F